MNALRKATGVVLILATIAAGIWFDVVVMLVGGITEIVRGAEAHPASGHDLGWGIAHIVFSGLVFAAAWLLVVLRGALFFTD